MRSHRRIVASSLVGFAALAGLAFSTPSAAAPAVHAQPSDIGHDCPGFRASLPGWQEWTAFQDPTAGASCAHCAEQGVDMYRNNQAGDWDCYQDPFHSNLVRLYVLR
ncbi:hypothetical protein [Fodinicola feengrottensis]|uniref:Secreted protein n=1 Tax=Fodinicola feengrottensis TaxID=435914 RepID=A0ABN2HGA9_9ACTN|nr:hypothetical protein [Fodinicola feengrottensis]